MSVDSSIYKVRMFRERGYIRQRCPICGNFFWSLKKRNDCGDAPCSNYTFISKRLSRRRLSVKESRDVFLRFFERKGHRVIQPYPVVARWRDDLYLTIASIVVFQPHVTSGIVPPPANPLVIAQPCIRLEDLDSIGYTFGRHLTSFIMGGHHAFNYPDKKVYFSDETVELAKEFFVNELGIPEDELVFKESWWEGGGNAGPCFEVSAGGLELATLVFMMYKVSNGSYEEIPIKIVDTGYGIERIAWFTQGTPTAFHAIYGDLVSRYRDILGVEGLSNDELVRAAGIIGKLNPREEGDFERLVKTISMSEDGGVRERLINEVRVYALLDHVRTSALMLADGIVPSNSGEGYLARLVLRRLFRILALLDKLSSDVVAELYSVQASYWKDMFPSISDRLDYILDVSEIELRKFKEIVEKAPRIIRRYLRSRGISVNELIELYDSHGIPPDLVSDIAGKYGVRVEVPSNFYAVVASKHGRSPIKPLRTGKVPDDVVELINERGISATEHLFHIDPYLKEFTGKVVLASGNYLVLDRTAFYPEGGGQESDRGLIELPDGRACNVVDVQKVGDVVVHKLDCRLDHSVEGVVVKGVIDWHRRFSLMRHHTATHIVLGAARRVLGEHIWQAGAEKRVDYARLDITHYKNLTNEEIRKIEDIANEVIDEGLEVTTKLMGKYEAEGRYGFRLYEGGVILKPVIRVVEIKGHDVEACFGTHVRNTREVGAIKIVKVDRIADGVVRLEFVAGSKVSLYARRVEEVLGRASQVLGGEVVSRAKSLTRELSELRSMLRRYSSLYSEVIYQRLLESSIRLGNISLHTLVAEIPDVDAVRSALIRFSRVFKEGIALIAYRVGNGMIVEASAGDEAASELPVNKLVSRIAEELGGRGGGSLTHATGRVNAALGIEEFRRIVAKVAAELISHE